MNVNEDVHRNLPIFVCGKCGWGVSALEESRKGCWVCTSVCSMLGIRWTNALGKNACGLGWIVYCCWYLLSGQLPNSIHGCPEGRWCLRWNKQNKFYTYFGQAQRDSLSDCVFCYQLLRGKNELPFSSYLSSSYSRCKVQHRRRGGKELECFKSFYWP